MNCHTLPRALFMALVAVAVAPPAAAALPPIRVEVVDDATLGTLNGKFFGANLLVGLRIDLVSSLSTPQNGSASATGSLYVTRIGNGFDVQVDSRSNATAGAAPAAANPLASATGAESLQIDGIGQVSQIAGDGNRMTNLTTISFLPASAAGPAATAQFNGQTHSSASAGAMTAHVTFLDGGLQLALSGAGAALAQQLHTTGASGHVLQTGQIAGDGMVGFNQMQLQLTTSPMSTQEVHRLGVEQALAGLSGLGR